MQKDRRGWQWAELDDRGWIRQTDRQKLPIFNRLAQCLVSTDMVHQPNRKPMEGVGRTSLSAVPEVSKGVWCPGQEIFERSLKDDFGKVNFFLSKVNEKIYKLPTSMFETILPGDEL